jgi:pimeloyl-ACP methyl ester carboxylesterase
MPQLKLKDGRALEFLDNGVESSQAIVLHHGTPSDATVWASWLLAAHALGTRAVAYSRAGYGQSDRRPLRRVGTVTSDISELLDHLGVRSCVAIGWSGGGPHALANASESRCRGAVTLAGVAPYGMPDLEFLDGMGTENHDEFAAAAEGETALRAWLEVHGRGLKTINGTELIAAFGGLIGAADKAVLTPQFAAEMAAVMRSSLANSFDGWIDDDLAFVMPWGFDPADLKAPVCVWQGDQDFMVPHPHSRWLAQHIPGAQLSLVPGHGHLSLVTTYRNAILVQARALLD